MIIITACTNKEHVTNFQDSTITKISCQSISEAAATVELCEVVEPFNKDIHPLMVRANIESPERVSVELSAVAEQDGHTVTVLSSEPAAVHRLLMAGLRAERTYNVKVSWRSPDGLNVGETELQIRSGGLPPDLPTVTLITGELDSISSDITIFTVAGFDNSELQKTPPTGYTPGLALAVDATGEIVWFARHPYMIHDIRQTTTGTFTVSVDATSAREFNAAGQTLREWTGRLGTRAAVTGYLIEGDKFLDYPKVGKDAIRIDTDMIHHEVQLTDDEELLFLSSELRELHFDDQQCSEEHGEPRDFDGTYGLIGDVIVWADAKTGEIIRRISLVDVLQPQVNTELLFNCQPMPYLNQFYSPEYPGNVDWTHANAIELDEARNLIWVSLRHLDAVIGLRMHDDAEGAVGELVHWLGPVKPTLELVSEGLWPLHQHAPELQPNGNLLIYDNGNGRTRDDTGSEDYTRTVEYSIDLQAGTIKQVWEYISSINGDTQFYPSLGDADRLGQRQCIDNRR